MHRWYYFLLAGLLPFTALAQSKLNNAIYFEGGGNAVQYSVNYEYRFFNTFVTKIGLGGSNAGLFVPVTFGKVFFRGAHHIETSIGITYAHYDVEEEMQDYEHADRLFLATFLGYRYDKPDRRFFFKVGFTPFYLLTEMDADELKEGNRFIPYFGIGGGVKIGKR
jgi:hypothetical protein